MAIKYLDAKRIRGSSTLAINEATYTTQCFDDNDDTADSDQLATRSGNNRHWGGLKVVSSGALNGKYAKKIRLKLHVNGATTGNLVGQIRSGCTSGSSGSQGTNRLTSTNTIDLATLQDSTTFIEFTFDGSYAFGTNSDEFIGIYWAANQSNGSNDIWIALRLSSETANTADVITATNDGAPNQTDFEFWTSLNANMNITYDEGTLDEKTTLIDSYNTVSFAGGVSGNPDTKNLQLPTNPLQGVGDGGDSDSAFTISMWMKSNNGIDSGDAIMGTMDGASGGDDHFLIRFSDGDGLEIYDGVTSHGAVWGTDFTRASINDNAWHHIALTRPNSSSVVTAYLDGVDKGDETYTGDFFANSDWLTINGRGDNTPLAGVMSIQDLGFWTRELSGADIAVLATGKPIDKATLATTYTTGLVGNWKFDGNYAQTNGSSGTNTGVAGAGVSIATTGGEFEAFSNLPENTLFEETNLKTFANSQSNAGITTYWLQSNAWTESGSDASTLVGDFTASTGNENSYDDRTALGLKITSGNALIGKKVRKIVVKLRKGNGSPTGDLQMEVITDPSGSDYSSVSKPVRHTFGTAMQGGADLTTSFVEHTFIASSPITVIADDTFIIKLKTGTETDNHGSPSPYFTLDCKDAAVSNAQMMLFPDSGNWAGYNTKGVWMKMYGET